MTKRIIELDTPGYTPEKLLDYLIVKLELKNDAALGKRLELASGSISKIRNHKLGISPEFILNVHDESGLTIVKIRDLAGLPAYTAKGREQ